MARLPESVDRVLSPSRFLIDRFVAGGWGREQFTYWPNGVPAVADSVGSRPESSRPSGSLRVGFMGSVTPQKGLHVLARAHRQLKRGTVELHIHGDVKFDPSYWSDVRRDLVDSEVHVHGAFAAGEAARVLAPLDVLVVPSIWYENAPLVISEARASGVPVLTSRLGGMMEMVEDGNDGLLFTPGDPDDLARSLEALATDRDRLLDLTRSCRLPRTLEDDAGALRELYQSLMDE